jgi:hypothetical protein
LGILGIPGSIIWSVSAVSYKALEVIGTFIQEKIGISYAEYD